MEEFMTRPHDCSGQHTHTHTHTTESKSVQFPLTTRCKLLTFCGSRRARKDIVLWLVYGRRQRHTPKMG